MESKEGQWSYIAGVILLTLEQYMFHDKYNNDMNINIQ